MKITFHHPPTGTTNPLIDFEPWNPSHYPPTGEVGVYIYGIRAKLDGVLKFIPIVVGEGSLGVRLFTDHYNGKFVNPLEILLGYSSYKSGDPKELWDFSKHAFNISDIKNIYSDMSAYNRLTSSHKIIGASKLTKLIFFQNADFFHQKLGITSLPWKTDLKTEQSIPYLLNLSGCCSADKLTPISELITRIITTLNNFRKDFYFVYASDKNNEEIVLSDSASRKHVEYQVKESLKKIDIHTTADAGTKLTTPIQIDISRIKNELVNVHGHSYDDPFGNYINPLILK
jgi:hypothetical protein